MSSAPAANPMPPRARPHVVAHRGASAEAPENTLAAYRRALAIGVDGVELDVHLSADGVPVVIHDGVLDRTTDGQGPVGARTQAELRRLDAGRWFGEAFAGERIPALAEALDLLRLVRVIVELKRAPGLYPHLAARATEVIRASAHSAVTISSFDHALLLEVRAQLPVLETAVLYVGRPVDPVGLAHAAGATVLHPRWELVDAALVATAHAAGLRLETWTADAPDDLRRIVEWGPDGVMTNYPARLRAVLADMGFPLPRPLTA